MTNCIRCGAGVAYNFNRRLFLTTNGDFRCPAALPGEPEIHRIAVADQQQQYPANPQPPRASLLDVLLSLAGLFALFKGAEYIARGDFGGHHGQPQRYYTDSELEGMSPLARGIMQWQDPRRR